MEELINEAVKQNIVELAERIKSGENINYNIPCPSNDQFETSAIEMKGKDGRPLFVSLFCKVAVWR